jgi:excisionase family DNA binding protein
MTDRSLIEFLVALIKPVISEALREALSLTDCRAQENTQTNRLFLTVREAAKASGLGSSTIRLYIRKRQLRAHQVGRRVLIKRSDLDSFLESQPMQPKSVS